MNINICRSIALESTRSELADLIQKMSEESESYRIALYTEKRMLAELKAQIAIQSSQLRAIQSDTRIIEYAREELETLAQGMDKLL